VPDWFEFIRVSLGAFVTSPGFGAAVAGVAAWGAYKGISSRIIADRDMATIEEDNARWWEMANWLWDNRQLVDLEQAVKMLENLEDLT
jgi:hypothetical protein